MLCLYVCGGPPPGAAFGTVENIVIYMAQYVFMNGHMSVGWGLFWGVWRALLTVPMHMGTALMMGVSMGHHRFLDHEPETW